MQSEKRIYSQGWSGRLTRMFSYLAVLLGGETGRWESLREAGRSGFVLAQLPAWLVVGLFVIGHFNLVRTQLDAALSSNEGIPTAVPSIATIPDQGLVENLFDLKPRMGVVWAKVKLPGDESPAVHAIEWVSFFTFFGPDYEAVCREQSGAPVPACEAPYITANDLEWWNRPGRSVVIPLCTLHHPMPPHATSLRLTDRVLNRCFPSTHWRSSDAVRCRIAQCTSTTAL